MNLKRLILAILLSSPCWATFGAPIQTVNCHYTSLSSGDNAKTCTISGTGTGNLLVIATQEASFTSAGFVTSITDDKSNFYSESSGARVSNSDTAYGIWKCTSTISGATTLTVTFNCPTALSNASAFVHEFSGGNTANPVEATGTQNTTGSPVTPSFTTTCDNELLFAQGRGENSNLTGISSPWTMAIKDAFINVTITAYQVLASHGTSQGAFTATTSQPYISSGASFFPVGCPAAAATGNAFWFGNDL